MPCSDEIKDLIFDSIDGPLSDLELQTLKTHFDQCPGCKLLYDDLHAVKSAMAQDTFLSDPPAGLHNRIMSSIKTERNRRRLLIRRVIPSLAAAAVFIVVLKTAPMLRPSDNYYIAPEPPVVITSGTDVSTELDLSDEKNTALIVGAGDAAPVGPQTADDPSQKIGIESSPIMIGSARIPTDALSGDSTIIGFSDVCEYLSQCGVKYESRPEESVIVIASGSADVLITYLEKNLLGYEIEEDLLVHDITEREGEPANSSVMNIRID